MSAMPSTGRLQETTVKTNAVTSAIKSVTLHATVVPVVVGIEAHDPALDLDHLEGAIGLDLGHIRRAIEKIIDADPMKSLEETAVIAEEASQGLQSASVEIGPRSAKKEVSSGLIV